MFGFMKKLQDKDKDKDEKKKDLKKVDKKTEKPLTDEELRRLEESKASFLRRSSDAKKTVVPRSVSKDSVSSSDDLRQTTPPSESGTTITSAAQVEIAKTVKVPPPLKPKPKKGILKDKSNYGPEVPNQGVRGKLDDTVSLEANTLANEFLPGRHDGKTDSSASGSTSVKKSIKQGSSPVLQNLAAQSPSNSSPKAIAVQPNSDEKTYVVELKLPEIATTQLSKAREISLSRLPSGDFGFTLRKGTVLVHNPESNTEKRNVVFAEPGSKNLNTGLLPGDRLLAVNGRECENASREEIIDLIKAAGNTVTLKVQPVPELSELSLRSVTGGDDALADEMSKASGQRYKSRQVRIL